MEVLHADAEDSRRLAEQLRVGDVRGSFVPRDDVVVLRDPTASEGGNVKVGNSVSDVFGISGGRFPAALLKPEPPTPAGIAE